MVMMQYDPTTTYAQFQNSSNRGTSEWDSL